MVMHQIGKPDSATEFRRKMPRQDEDIFLPEAEVLEQVVDPLAHEKEVVQKMIETERGD